MGSVGRYLPAIVCLLIAMFYGLVSQSYSQALLFASIAVVAAGAAYWRQRRGPRPVTSTSVLMSGFLFWLLAVVLVLLAVFDNASARPFFIIAAVGFAAMGFASLWAYLKLRRADTRSERAH